MLNLDIESTGKTRSIVNNVGRALAKKKVLMLGSNEIDIINISDSYGTYMVVYVSEKEDEEKPLQDIQPMNGLKVSVGAEKADGMAITFTTYENATNKTFGKRFSCIHFDDDQLFLRNG